MQTGTERAIREHAEREYPKEACGLIVASGRRERYVPCRNTGDGAHFVMPPQDYAAAEEIGPVQAVVHSHPDASAAPSEADLVACEASGKPWVICSVFSGKAQETRIFKPSGYKAPLVGRMFFHGVLDCYTLVRDFYERELGIALPDFERADDWWSAGEDLYMKHFREAGFTPLEAGETLSYADVILMQIRAPVTNHAGIFLGTHALAEAPDLYPVPNAMLHHMYGRLSERAVYGGYWAEHTTLIIRHRK